MLGDLQRQPEPRALEEPRRERIEELAAHVAVGRRRLAEAEMRRHELDLGAGARERGRELVVVGRRERRRICQDDPHPTVGYAACRSSSAPGTSSTATPCRRERRALPPRDGRARRRRRAGGRLPPGDPALGAAAPRRRGAACRPSARSHARPRLRSAELGRWLTDLNHGLLRSAVTGQANAILVAPRSRRWTRSARSWSARAGERRICHGASARRADRRRELPRHRRRVGRRAVPCASPTSSRAQDAERGDPRRRREPAAGRRQHLRAAPRARLLGAAAREHRPDRRPRAPVDAARRVARGAAPRRWSAPLRSRAGRTHRRMTFEEARAQFPVLERYAYLNAGTNGPLARATVDALVEQAQRDLADGRSSKAYFERMLELREEARRGLRRRARRRRRAHRARRLDDARLRDRARRPRARPARTR